MSLPNAFNIPKRELSIQEKISNSKLKTNILKKKNPSPIKGKNSLILYTTAIKKD